MNSPDVVESAGLYASVFGWTYDVRGPEMGHDHMAFRDGRAVAGLGQMAQGSETPAMWTVYFKADDVAAMTERAGSLGGTTLAGPMEIPVQGPSPSCKAQRARSSDCGSRWNTTGSA